jgi:hypothetical protein
MPRLSATCRLLLNSFLVIQNTEKRLPHLREPGLNIVFVYDDELLLFKLAYLRRRSALWKQ